MGSRAVGGLLLVVAVTASLVTSRAVNPPTTDGRATIEPPAPPPAVQTCLAEVPAQQPWLPSGDLVTVPDHLFVPCSEPHAGEIFYVYDTVVSLADNDSGPRSFCAEPGFDAETYLGAAPLDNPDVSWHPRLSYQVTLIGPDQRQLAAGQTWSACVLSPAGILSPSESSSESSNGELTKSLRGILESGDRVPAVLGWCMTGDTNEMTGDIPAPCNLGHTTEVLGTISGELETGTTTASMLASCQALAVHETQRPTLLDEPDLFVGVTMVAFGESGPYSVQAVPPRGAAFTWCVVRAKQGRALTDTIRGLNNASIPWVN